MIDVTYMELKTIDPDGRVKEFYLHHDGRLPVVLGTGRNAVVFLARTSKDLDSAANEYRAIKFLKDDIDQEYAEETARRFFDEAEKTKNFGRLHNSFVRYDSLGVIGDIDSSWEMYYGKHTDRIWNRGAEFDYLKSYFFLQGPFYVLELCQGTLQDLLDKNIHWAKLQVYQHINSYQGVLSLQSRDVFGDIQEVIDKFIDNGTDITTMSGYGILNSFKNDTLSNSVRNYAVLELFEKIVWTVRQLHSDGQGGGLAHRDLKPGNVFLQHPADAKGFNQLFIKLSDLGYVANSSLLESGDLSLRMSWRNPGALTPGSQFFRAPEQAELPIEVRVDVDERDKTCVIVHSSKVGAVQHGDWLSIGDFFIEKKGADDFYQIFDPSLFKIIDVDYGDLQTGSHAVQSSYMLKLDRRVELASSSDLQAHIIRSTGFHTDGFSLGAILYDLASGGKNPELFYTYCLTSFTTQFAKLFESSQYTVDDVIEILSPDETFKNNGVVHIERLQMKEKLQIVRNLLRSHSVDEIVESILGLSLKRTSAGDDIRDELRNYRFRNFHLVNDLLKDHRGVSIPKGILKIIVKCMLRDVHGAYYMSNRETGFLSEGNRRSSEQIYQDVEYLLSQAPYQLPSSFPSSLRTNLLFKLRALAISSHQQSQSWIGADMLH
jgi:serine/threonine protein kinase